MNVPYVKQYDKDGNLLNPIKGGFTYKFLNRKERRNLELRGGVSNNKKKKKK